MTIIITRITRIGILGLTNNNIAYRPYNNNIIIIIIG